MSKSDAESRWPDPRWYEAHENPYGLRIFDCRQVTQTMILGTTRCETAEEWARLLLVDGQEFRGAAPVDPVTALCNLRYPRLEGTTEGPFFIPLCMEDRWFIYAYDELLIFLAGDSFTVGYRAWYRLESDALVIWKIEGAHERTAGDGTLAIRNVDFLIKSHRYRFYVPHVLPLAIGDDPKQITSFSFWEYGRRACFATREDTLAIPWREVDYKAATRLGFEGRAG